MTVKEIRTLVQNDCFNYDLWVTWRKHGAPLNNETIDGYLSCYFITKFITGLLSIASLVSLIFSCLNKENVYAVSAGATFIISFAMWFASHWCGLGRDIKRLADLFEVSQMRLVSEISAPYAQDFLTYQAAKYLFAESYFGMHDPRPLRLRRKYSDAHNLVLRFGLCHKKWDIYFENAKKVEKLTVFDEKMIRSMKL